jgi:trk system potassium uptake protein TrkA
MKIVIADGMHEADYIISKYNSKANDLIVINEQEDACKYLSVSNGIPVMCARCTRESDLREAGAEDADLFIALSKNDMTNYVACKTAKQLLGAKRCIATVVNPKNVEVFRKLGIDSVLSSTYLLGEQIRNAASIENLINTLSLEDNKIIILEVRITPDLSVEGKTLKEINISDIGSISTVTRNQKVIIPNGNTELKANDKVLIVTTEESREAVTKVFQRKK